MESNSFFFYDLETSGLNPREDRIMQFAGQRTTLGLEPIGEPVNILIKLTDDALPSPGAILVTKITPQDTLRDGIGEVDFVKIATEEIFTPGTVAVGYNTVRFDDEFMRAILWRNFIDPYEWEWKDGRSRWDMLDVVRLTRALRPEGINWPFTEKGKPTNRLELLTKLNHLEHSHAHDALSDVYATIAVAKLIREKQPKLFDYLYKMKDKREIKALVNLDSPRPFVYASGRYSSEYNKTTVAYPLAKGKNGNILVCDLRYSPKELTQDSSRTAPYYPIVKELCYNKCPAVAPLNVLDTEDGWAKIDLNRDRIEDNLKELINYPEFTKKVIEELEKRPEFPPAIEPEAALYDGFLNDADRREVARISGLDTNRLADYHPFFSDERLPDLLLHYKGRNFPQSLSEDETKKWQEYRKARIERLAPSFLSELELAYTRDEFIAEELKLYFESLLEHEF